MLGVVKEESETEKDLQLSKQTAVSPLKQPHFGHERFFSEQDFRSKIIWNRKYLTLEKR